MTLVFPYLIRRSESGSGGELLLRLKEGRSAYVVQLPIDQARMLAVEMRGLATDHCQQHHLAMRIAQTLGAEISHVVIKASGQADEACGMLRLVTEGEMKDVDVDAASALAMAFHIGLPIFMEGEFALADGLPRAAPSVNEASDMLGIPRVFRDVIEDLKMPGPEGESSA